MGQHVHTRAQERFIETSRYLHYRMKNASPRYTEFYKKMIDANEKRFKSELCKDCKPYYKEFIKTAKHLHGGKP